MRPGPGRQTDARLVALLRSRRLVDEVELERCLSELATGGGQRLPQLLLRRGLIDAGALGPLLAQAAEGSTAPAASASAAAPRQVGSYTLGRELARGGAGVVFEARDPALDRPVALKLLHGAAGDEVAVERLLREARIAGRLSHPGIVGIHAVGRTEVGGESVPYVAMPLLEGGCLSDVIGRLGPQRGAEMLAQVAHAVGHAHAAGVVHRDLKPGNVLLTADGRPVVTDFGLARAAESTRLTQTGAILGTPQYMAPEQVHAERDVGPPADVWALGVMLYQALTGRRPFRGRTIEQLFAEICGDPPDFRCGGRGIPAPLRTICLTALAGDPGRRYADAGALAADLDRWLAGESIEARAQSWPSQLGQHARRHPWVALAVALALLSVGTAASLLWRDRRRSASRAALRGAAMAAAAEARWDDVRGLTARGLALGADVELTRLAAQAEAARQVARQADTRRQAAAERQRELLAQLAPLRRQIEDARGATYRAESAIRRTLLALEPTLRTLRALAERPELAGEAEPWTLLGAGEHLLGRTEVALKALREAADRAPGDAHVQALLGRLLLERSQDALLGTGIPSPAQRARAEALIAEASTRLSATLGGWSGSRPMDRDLVRMYRLLAARDLGELDRGCQAGIAEYGQELGSETYWLLWLWVGDGAARLERTSKALARRPHDPRAHLYRGLERLNAGQMEAARADFDRAVDCAPRWAMAYLQRGNALQNLGRHDAALADHDEALRLAPGWAVAYVNRAISKIGKGQLAAAEADCTTAIRLDPELRAAYTNRSTTRLEQRRYPEALADIARALALDPQDHLSTGNRGMIYLQTGQPRRALAEFDRAIALAPGYAKGYYNRANCRQALQMWNEAIADFGQALKRDPRMAWAHNNRGLIYQSARRQDLAIADFDAAIRIDPRFTLAHLNRGNSHRLLGQLAAALADFGRAEAVDPREPLVYGARAQVWMAQRQPRKALADLERALEVAPPAWALRAQTVQLRDQLRRQLGG